jgi:hypothetical protein
MNRQMKRMQFQQLLPFVSMSAFVEWSIANLIRTTESSDLSICNYTSDDDIMNYDNE